VILGFNIRDCLESFAETLAVVPGVDPVDDLKIAASDPVILGDSEHDPTGIGDHVTRLDRCGHRSLSGYWIGLSRRFVPKAGDLISPNAEWPLY
jgi:hypothetical protein